MLFFSDNAATVCPEVMTALIDANISDLAYDNDSYSRRLDDAFSELFGTEVAALSISTGTAANALALAALCPPHGSVICSPSAHIQVDECGAPEFYTHGAKLILAEGDGAKLTPASVLSVLDSFRPGDVHQAQPHALSISNATELGLAYTPEEVASLGDLAKAKGLGFHMDGARFGNAVAHLGCSPAALTWQAGVDILSFGFVKNGGMSAEAMIFFRTDLIAETRYRRKRGGHLLSKNRYAAAQILAMIEGDVWLRNARAANTGAVRIGQSVNERLLYPVQANELFIRISPEESAKLRAQGFNFYDWSEGCARFVVSYDQSSDNIDHLIQALAAL
tara:strand:- start:17782 stop:18786 length:1005 start_codon:yes stop_codon:yes gene_type:complete